MNQEVGCRMEACDFHQLEDQYTMPYILKWLLFHLKLDPRASVSHMVDMLEVMIPFIDLRLQPPDMGM